MELKGAASTKTGIADMILIVLVHPSGRVPISPIGPKQSSFSSVLKRNLKGFAVSVWKIMTKIVSRVALMPPLAPTVLPIINALKF